MSTERAKNEQDHHDLFIALTFSHFGPSVFILVNRFWTSRVIIRIANGEAMRDAIEAFDTMSGNQNLLVSKSSNQMFTNGFWISRVTTGIPSGEAMRDTIRVLKDHEFI